MKPKVLDVEKLSKTDNPYEDLKPYSEIVYKKVYISGYKSNNYGYGMGHTGVLIGFNIQIFRLVQFLIKQ